MNDIVETFSQSVKITMVYNNDSISHIYSITESIQNNIKSKMEFYKVPEATYINQNEIWQEYSGPEKYTSTYKPILDTFLSIFSKFEMIENSNNYTFKFEGKDGDIYRTIAEPFNITFGQLSDNNIELDIEFIIEKENFFIKNFNINAFADYDNNKEAKVKTRVSFEDFNEIDSNNFLIPEGLGELSNTI